MKLCPITSAAWILVIIGSRSLANPVDHAQGEIAGEVTSSSVLLQSRLTSVPGPELDASGDIPGSPGVACFEWSEQPDLSATQRSPWLHAEASSDFIVRSKITGLREGTDYYYRLMKGPDEAHAQVGPIRHFKTLNLTNSSQGLSFCIGNCMNYGAFMSGIANGGGPVTATEDDKKLGYPVFAAMSALHPDFFIGAGDTVYYDLPASSAAHTLPELRRKWHEQFRFPRMIEFLGSCPSYWMKDDHDFRFDDADRSGLKLPSPTTGIEVFREQMPIDEAGDLETPTYRTYRVHQHLQLWFMEGRDYRSENRMADGPEKSIWGSQQRQWLQRTLKQSDATWKIIITPTPMVGPDRASKSDNHTNPDGFRGEADSFFHWLVEQKMSNVMTFCGDRHWQYHSIHPLGIEEFSVGALNDENSIDGIKPGDQKSTDPEGLIQQPYLYSEATGGFLYVKVTAGTTKSAQLNLEFHDDHGKLLHQVVKNRDSAN